MSRPLRGQVKHGAIHAQAVGAELHGDAAPPYREGRRNGARTVKPQSTCWCEREFVDITYEEVAAGITHSCGLRRCKP